MSTERLSRLQKWILVTALDRHEERIWGYIIYRDYYHLISGKDWRPPYPRPQYKYEAHRETYPARLRKYPVVSASLKRLREKGLLELTGHGRFPIHRLTKEGRKKALILKDEPSLGLRKDSRP